MSNFLMKIAPMNGNFIHVCFALTLYVTARKIAEFANSVHLDEVAHDEPPHLDLHCLPSSL